MGKLLPSGAKGGQGSAAGPAGLAFVEGVSASMRPVEAVIHELAQSDVPVLVLAEAGAGKHATAQRIHQMSQRSAQPFRAFDRVATLQLHLDQCANSFKEAQCGLKSSRNRTPAA